MQMPLVLTNRRRRGGSASAPAFSPSSLYSSGSQGIWLDPSDLSTMFSDRAGTTPVTTPGTVVGLRLDKSKGLVLGSELVTFSSDPADYTLTSSTAVTDGAGLLVTKTASNQYVTRSTLMALTAGKSYLITVGVQNISCTEGAFRFFLSAGPAGTTLIGTLVGTLNSGTLRGYVHVPAGFTSGYLNIGHSSGSIGQFKLNSISVRELAGNHATAPTDAARPMYGVEPKGGRRNLLTWSEGFDNAAWSMSSAAATVVANTALSPDGTLTADTVSVPATDYRRQNVSTAITGNMTVSVYVKAAPSGSATHVRLTTNNSLAWGTGGSVKVALTSDWQRIQVTWSQSSSGTVAVMLGSVSASGTGDADCIGNVLVWGAQLETGSTATNYQRVTTAYDITESGVPSCHYVQYDGSDDSMSTSAIDFTATDKMSVFAGVRKLSDVEMTIVELSNTWWNNTGTFAVGTLPTPYFSYSPALRGTASTYYTAGVDSTPNSRVLSALFDIAGTTSSQEVVFRADGTLKTLTSVSGTNAGTGNFGNYPLFLGRRGGATLPLNGRDFGIIIVGKAASAGEITDTELWLSDKTAEVDVAKSISPNIYTRSGDTILDRANSIIERRTV